MFARIKKTIYLCIAFERKRFYNLTLEVWVSG